MAKIVGRKKEQQQLEHLLDSKEAEFLVVYGRRRVGKTFLIRNYFKDRLTFYHTALSPLELEGGELLQAQLQNFTSSLRRSGMEIDAAPQSWFEAFDLLIDFLSGKPKTEKIIVFIDEMPWLDTPKSGFVTAFEHFWNGWAAGQDNLLLVACGSATTWIVDRLLSNKGGLYNRVTQEMHLVPFTLKECEEYYREHGVVMDRYDQVQCYEDVCMVHVQQIRQALGILGVQSEASPWHYVSVDKKMGAQIDLLINRSDRIVDICEMKFCVNTYRMDKKADESIRNKIQVVMDTVRGRKAIHPVIVTTYGLAKNEYSSRIQRVITMDDLFC